jgi:hypothetical protein
MPQTKLQDFIYTIIMSFIMVYAMICYNISLALGGMSNAVFLAAFHELMIMWPLGAVLEFFIAGRGAKILAFRFVSPEDRPFIIASAISSMIVCLMCPMMSMAATILFSGINSEMIAVWLQKLVCNFPMAFCFQIFFAGPFVRSIFTKFQKH